MSWGGLARTAVFLLAPTTLPAGLCGQAGSGPPPGPSCPCRDGSARGRSEAPATLGLQATWVASCTAGVRVSFKAPTPRSDGGHTQPPPSLANMGTGSPTSGPQMCHSRMLGPALHHALTGYTVLCPRAPAFIHCPGKGRPGESGAPVSPTGSDTGLGVRLASRLASAPGRSRASEAGVPGEAPSPPASCWDLGGQKARVIEREQSQVY